jgi:predicted HTH transcriptional regulator
MLNVSTADKVEVSLPLLPEDKVLDYVRRHGFITRKQCANLLDLKDIPARTFLFQMRDKGILKQKGFKKGSRYVLSE